MRLGAARCSPVQRNRNRATTTQSGRGAFQGFVSTQITTADIGDNQPIFHVRNSHQWAPLIPSGFHAATHGVRECARQAFACATVAGKNPSRGKGSSTSAERQMTAATCRLEKV